MATPSIVTEKADGVLCIHIERMDKKNALTQAMYQELSTLLSQAQQSDDIAVVLFQSFEGCFTSGNDLHDFLSANDKNSLSAVIGFLHALHQFPKPIFTAVSGPAVGIGTTLLLHSDINFADKTATFQLPFVNLGLVPEAGSSVLLPQMLGYPRAAELLLLGQPFDALKAEKYGLLNEVVDNVNDYAFSVAKRCAKQPRTAMMLAKKLLKQNQQDMISHTINDECEYFYQQLQSDEARAIMNQFFAKK